MKYYFVVTSLFCSILLISCGNDKEEKDDSLSTPTVVSPTTKSNTSDSPLLRQQNIPGNNITTTAGANTVNIAPQNNAVATTIPATAAQTIPSGNNTQLNPPHGQPGHRCDIAVGAPLNSKPAQSPTPVTATANQTIAKINPQAVVQKVAPGMNPQHGQPGHRCDIAVGAPLNSKPAEPAAVTPAIVNPAITAPAKSDSIKK